MPLRLCLEDLSFARGQSTLAVAIALDGLEKAWRFIERAVRDGSDREARWNMAMVAMEGAMCFQKGLGAVHALSHPGKEASRATACITAR